MEELQAACFGSSKSEFEGFLDAIGEAKKVVAEHAGGRVAYSHLPQLLRLFGERFAEAKGERSGLDFEDLQLEAVRLLRESTAVRESYAGRFRHILVDEFQDTNALQLELVELLRCRREPASSSSATSSSRSTASATPTSRSFAASARRFARARAGAVLPLSGNFRSRPEVIATANRIGELMLPGFRPLTVGAAVQAEGDPPGWRPAPWSCLLTEEKGWEELDLKLPVDDRTPVKRVAEARFLAARLRQLTEAGVPRGEIVVLLRAFTHVDAYEEALERAGLRPYVVGGRGYWSGAAGR